MRAPEEHKTRKYVKTLCNDFSKKKKKIDILFRMSDKKQLNDSFKTTLNGGRDLLQTTVFTTKLFRHITSYIEEVKRLFRQSKTI